MKKLNIFFLVSIFILISCSEERHFSEVIYSKEVVSKPVPFAKDVISTEVNSEFELTFSVDGLKTYFSRRAPGEKQKIYISDFKNDLWSEPVLAHFSTDRDETPFISPDGSFFFFGSERPIPNRPNKGNFDMNIWMMERTNRGWSEPIPLPEHINEVQMEGEEWPTSNNNFIFSVNNDDYYFTTMKRGTKAIALYETTLIGNEFSQPRPIEGIFEDEKFWVYSAVISPDGNYLIFNSFEAPGGTGGEDIFVSKKTEKGWSLAKPIGGMVNTKNEESSPRFSRDGNYFFFSRAANLGNYEYGAWSIYYIET